MAYMLQKRTMSFHSYEKVSVLNNINVIITPTSMTFKKDFIDALFTFLYTKKKKKLNALNPFLNWPLYASLANPRDDDSFIPLVN